MIEVQHHLDVIVGIIDQLFRQLEVCDEKNRDLKKRLQFQEITTVEIILNNFDEIEL